MIIMHDLEVQESSCSICYILVMTVLARIYCQLSTCDRKSVLGSRTSLALHSHRRNTCDSRRLHGSCDACRTEHGHETPHRMCTQTLPVSDSDWSGSAHQRSSSVGASNVPQNYSRCQFQCLSSAL